MKEIVVDFVLVADEKKKPKDYVTHTTVIPVEGSYCEETKDILRRYFAGKISITELSYQIYKNKEMVATCEMVNVAYRSELPCDLSFHYIDDEFIVATFEDSGDSMIPIVFNLKKKIDTKPIVLKQENKPEDDSEAEFFEMVSSGPPDREIITKYSCPKYVGDDMSIFEIRIIEKDDLTNAA